MIKNSEWSLENDPRCQSERPFLLQGQCLVGMGLFNKIRSSLRVHQRGKIRKIRNLKQNNKNIKGGKTHLRNKTMTAENPGRGLCINGGVGLSVPFYNLFSS